MVFNVLITGGAGFIGRWLVGKCLERGWRVWVYDNLTFSKESNLDAYKNEICFYKADILDYETLISVIKQNDIKLIYHLAAYHYIPYCNAHPLETIRVNVEGTASVMQAAVEGETEQVIIASTGAIYRGVDAPLREDAEAVAPTDIYGLSKVLAENVAHFYSETSNLRCIVARLFNTYGPYEATPHLIPHILKCLRTYGNQVILGNLHTKRDYIFVEDTAEALVALGELSDRKYDVLNVGTGVEYSAVEIIQVITKILGREIKIVQDDAQIRRVDKPHQIADTRKINQACGWRARYTLHEGLRELLYYNGLI